MPFDSTSIRRQFPILNRTFGGNPLCYLDSAATSQKPQKVLDAMTDFYGTKNANVNRGVHPLAEEATLAHDAARKTVQKFLNAKHSYEIVFTRGTTESINLVARSFGETLSKGDRIVLSVMEHHSNIVPWMQLSERKGVEIDWLPIDFDEKILEKFLSTKKVKLVSITGLSNVLGVRPPLEKIIELAHTAGAKVLLDAAQMAAHEIIDVQKLDCDFLAFSGHKIYGPTGIGVLFGKAELLKKMPPFLGGGDMIQSVTTEGFTTAELPRKFEAGTLAAAEAVGLAAAIDWIESTGADAIHEHESTLIAHAVQQLKTIKGLTILGPEQRTGCVSFTLDGIHPHDLTDVLGKSGICLRAGHHCTQPLHKFLGINASARLSVAAYNTLEEIDRCVDAIVRAQSLLQR
jgi:cysteine desulfurase/selenocysteine lyase